MAATLRFLVRSWRWLHLLSLAVVLIQPTTPAIVLGRYSRTALVVFLFLLVSLPIVAWVTSRALKRIEQPVPFRWLVPGVVPIALFYGVLWAVNIGPTISYVIVRLYLSTILLTLALWLSTSFQLRLSPRVAAGAVVVIGFVLILASTTLPGVFWTDEGYNISLALSFAHQHKLAVPIVSLTPSLYGPIYSTVYMGLGYWLSFFGVGLASVRIFTLLVGLAGLIILFFALSRLYSRAIALCVVLPAAFTLASNNYLRSDVALIFYLSLALYFFVTAEQQNRPALHLLVGLAVGFSLDGHPNAYRFILTFLIGYVLLLAASRRRAVVCLAIGLVLGAAAYLALYMSLAPDSFGRQLRTLSINLNPGQIFSVMADQVLSIVLHSPFLFLLALLGAVAALRRHSKWDRFALTLLVFPVLLLALMYGYYRDYYLLHMLVPLCFLAATGLDWLSQQIKLERRATFLLTVAGFLLVGSAAYLWPQVGAATGQRYDDALRVADQIRPLVDRSQVVVGIDPLYWRMWDYPHFVDLNVGSVYAREHQSDEVTAWETINPSAVIIVEGYPVSPPLALRTYIEKYHFQPVGCWITRSTGKVTLFVRTLPLGKPPAESCVPG